MPYTHTTTPREDGFRMPGEFERHAGCWMLWPERPDNWRLQAGPAQEAFAAVAEAVAQFEPVTVGASAAQFANARRQLSPHVRVVELSANDAWARDVGPTCVVNDRGDVRGVGWRFNAWGGLYSDWRLDALVAQKILEVEGLDGYRAPLVLEGGSIHADGQGSLITTEECLLHSNRNPGLSQAEIAEHLRAYLGVEKIIWLANGVFHDETAGHVDNLCCFVRPGVVALTWTDDTSDPQHSISRDAWQRLAATTDARGRSFEVVRIHQPAPLTITADESAGVQPAEGTLPRRAGDRLAASYINFYIANGGVVAPVFGDRAHDAAAMETLRRFFPERRVVGIPAREILLGGGNIHCITQQLPQGSGGAYGMNPGRSVR
jgi:agmatine deiminase